MSEETKLYTDEEVAAILRCSTRTVKKLRSEGKLGFCRITAKIKGTRPSHIEAYLKSVEKKAA